MLNRNTLFVALLGMIIVISQHSFRWVLWEVETLEFIFVGFRAVLFFLFDIPLVILLIALGIYLTIEPAFREHFSDVATRIIMQRGGVWWMLLFTWMALGAFWANTPALARYGAIQTAGLVGMAFILAYMVQAGMARPLLVAFVVGAVFQAMLGIAQVATNKALGLGGLGELKWDAEALFGFIEENTFRAYGLTAHPNILAGYLLVSLFAVATLISHGNWRAWSTRFAAIAGIIIAVGLLLTFSRATLTAGVGIGVIGVLFSPQARRFFSPRVVLMLMVPLLIGIVLVGVLFGDSLSARFQGLRDSEGVRRRLTFEFENTEQVIDENPIWGAGENNLMTEIGYNHPIIDQALYLPAHNAYVVVLAELGIPGLVLFWVGSVQVLISLSSPTPPTRFIWACALLVLAVIMLFDYYVWLDYRARLLVFWVLGMWWGYSLELAPLRAQEMPIPEDNENESEILGEAA